MSFLKESNNFIRYKREIDKKKQVLGLKQETFIPQTSQLLFVSIEKILKVL